MPAAEDLLLQLWIHAGGAQLIEVNHLMGSRLMQCAGIFQKKQNIAPRGPSIQAS